MYRMNRVLVQLQRWLIAHEIPVRGVLWNPGLSPPVEMCLAVDANPRDHYRANLLLHEFFTSTPQEALRSSWGLDELLPWQTSSRAPAPFTTSAIEQRPPTRTTPSTP